MYSFDVKRQMAPADIDMVTALVQSAERADGSRPLSDHLWLDLRHGGRTGFAAILATADEHHHGHDHGHDHLVAYCQLSRGNESWALELVVSPHHRYDIGIIGTEMIGRAREIVAAEGGGHVHWWVFEPTQMHHEIAERCGLSPGRRLLQLRRALPLDEHLDRLADEVESCRFSPGRDADEWLEVNNAAFATHPEQGGWDGAVLAARLDEAWFDPEGFLLHHVDGRLAGFCWTKMHRDTDPVLGEIYVVAVHPDFAGRGLGRRLVAAGLRHLSAAGAHVGMLFVDADNDAAMTMYRSLGFEAHHGERAFVGDVPAGSGAGTRTR